MIDGAPSLKSRIEPVFLCHSRFIFFETGSILFSSTLRTLLFLIFGCCGLLIMYKEHRSVWIPLITEN